MQNEILIIDDDRIVVKMNSLLVNESEFYSNFKLSSFENGREALNYLLDNNEENKNFVLLLDINMPVMNGWELLEEVSQEGFVCNIKVVLVISSISFRDIEKAKTFSNVIAFASKPLSEIVLPKVYNFMRGIHDPIKADEYAKLLFL